MPVATISPKGRITLPAEARRAIGLNAGDRVMVNVRDGVIVVERVGDFLALRGTLGRALPRSEEIAAGQDQATTRAMARP
jgi:AbrB family looped-hinge helix DNA binding protein